MSCIVYQTDAKTGTRYAYESVSYWDKEKQQPRSTRKYLGRVDETTGEIIRKKERSGHSEEKDGLDEPVASELSVLREKIKERDATIASLKAEIKAKDKRYKKLVMAVRNAEKLMIAELDNA